MCLFFTFHDGEISASSQLRGTQTLSSWTSERWCCAAGHLHKHWLTSWTVTRLHRHWLKQSQFHFKVHSEKFKHSRRSNKYPRNSNLKSPLCQYKHTTAEPPCNHIWQRQQMLSITSCSCDPQQRDEPLHNIAVMQLGIFSNSFEGFSD